MELRICLYVALTLLISCTHGRVPLSRKSLHRTRRNEHFPPPNVPTFRRDAVEHEPENDLSENRNSAYMTLEQFGTRSLPLRSAVESVPDIKETTRRLPLRDAVEKRLAPDSLINTGFDVNIQGTANNDFFSNYRATHPGYGQNSYLKLQPVLGSYQTMISHKGHVYPQFQTRQTFYTPVQYFKDLVGFRNVAPYRIDNSNQQLFSYPGFRGRSLDHDKEEPREIVDVEIESEDTKRIVCYLQAQSAYRREPLSFTPEDLDPQACTHIIYAFATIDPHTYNLISNDDEFDIVQGGYRAATGLKRFNPNLKVLLSVGGNREDASSRFTSMVTSAKKRREFIRSAINLLKTYDFDGIDIHWEYPGAEELGGQVTDKEYLNLFLEELSEIFHQRGWIVVVTAPASRFKIEDGYNPAKLADLVDFVNLQAYDFHRDREPVVDHHANLYRRPEDNGLNLFLSVDYAVKFWLRKGLPRSKLVVGLPFYGRSFTLQYLNETEIGASIKGPGKEGFYTQNPGLLAYFEICDMVLNEGWQTGEDTDGSPYIVNGDQWVGYDDDKSIAKKVSYIKQENLGGVFVWAADLDDFKGLCGQKWPLLNSINKYLKGTVPPPFNTDANPPTKPYGTCQSNGFYSDPKNCAAYYICKNGLSYHLSCGNNLMYDSVTAKCDKFVAQKCKPGQTIYVAQTLKDIDNNLKLVRSQEVKNSKPKVVCYVTNWAFYRKGDGKFVPEHIDQRLCTHVVYAFASLDPDKLLIKEFDPWADLENNLYERITSLKDTDVLVSVGGWTDSTGDKYSRLVSDGSARRRFVVGAVSFLRRHNFKGLHFDWNYPVCWQSNCKKGPASDKPNFTKLLQELRKEFDKQNPPLILAAAISGYKEVIDVAYDLPSITKSLDFLSVMTYDYHGAWEKQTGHVSPLYALPGDKYPQYNTDYTMEYIVSKGAPREKLIMGIPFYGQSFTVGKTSVYDEGTPSIGPGEPGEYTKQPGMLAYYEICNRVRNHRWVVNKRNANLGPYAYNKDQWVGYEDIDSVKAKAHYIKTKGYGGAVAWTIDLDDFNNRCCSGTFPLLRTLNQELGLISDSPLPTDCTKPPPPSTPAPPETTTGIDSGASSSDHHHHSEWTSTTTKKTTTSPWWTTKPSSSTPTSTAWWETTVTSKPTTIKPSSSTGWWETTPKPSKKPITSSSTGWWETTTKRIVKPTTTTKATTTTWWSTSKIPSTTTRKTTTPWWEATTKVTTPKPAYKPPVSSPDGSPVIPPPAVVAPEMDKPTQSCEPAQHIPDPANCNAYYRCVSGELKKQYCAGGLHWNRERNICDWPAEAKCSHKKPHLYSVCNENTFAPYAGDCSQYLHCLWGKYEVFQCAPGLHWNSDQMTCDWPEKAQCEESNENNDIDDIETQNPIYTTSRPQATYKPTTTKPPKTTTEWQYKPPSTTEWQYVPSSTTESTGGNEWEWHPPIPPTSEKPPLSEPLKPKSDYFKIVCYFTNWAWYRQGAGKYLPEDIDENLCTHVVYGFAVLDFSNLIIKAHDSWADFDNQFYKRVIGYKSKGIKVSLAIGGWNDSQGDKYSRLVNDPSARRRFIEHVVKFLEKWGFDGLDLDWEYPKCWQVDCKKGPDSDKQAFSAFIKELSMAFKPKGLLLSSAVSPSKTVIDSGYEVPVLGEYLDWVAVMTYDFHGQWDKQTGHVAPLFYHPEDEVAFFNSNFSINYWISEGVPRRKIVMGMPLYGQAFRLENESENGLNAKAPGPGEAGEYTRAAGFLAYYEICDKIKNKGWTVVQDPKRRMGPYAYNGNQWVSFDDQEMIRIKSEYIRRMDLGGGMIWALDLDDFKNRCGEGRHPLLTTIRNVLADPGTGQQEPIPPINNEEEIDGEEDDAKKPTVGQPQPVESEEEWNLPETVDQSQLTPQSHQTTSHPLVDPNSEFKVVCYFTNWAWYRQGHGKYLPTDIDPDLCTHIVYGFAVLDGDQLIIKPHDTWADFDNKFYEKVTALKAKGIKVLIAIGGWNDSAGDKYSRLVNNPSARRRFIAQVVDFIEMNNFDGLDLDWEYPKCWQVDCNKGPHSDKPAFAEFVRELHGAFQEKGWLLSAAVSPSRRVIDAGYDVPVLSQYLDWIAVMCYDYHGQWDKVTGHVAPMYAHPEDIDASFNTNFTINYWIEQGADRKKLVMGMPMYGQSFSLAETNDNGLNAPTYGGGEAGEETRARGFLAYYEICSNIVNKGWKVTRDRKGRIGPYAHLGDQWVSFDDIGMIRHKSEYIKAMGLGGGMIWALDLDDFKNICGCEEYPLLRTINRVLRNYAKPAPKCILGNTPHEPTKKPTIKPIVTTTRPITHKPTKPSYITTSTVYPSYGQPEIEYQPPSLQCDGSMFMPHETNCNQYYVCNQGQPQLQMCPSGLYWNENHCDWPENTKCHPDATTTTPIESSTSNEVDYEPQQPEINSEEESYLPSVEFEMTPTSVTDADEGYKVICYFTNWAWYRQGDGKYLPSDIDYNLCTHINYGFAVLDANTLTIKPHDSWADIDNEFYKQVTAYKAKGVKVLIAIGGWNDSLGPKYSRLVNDPGARARFITNVIEFIEKWDFDGLDLDWEYPKCWQVDCNKGPDSDKEGFAAFVQELSVAFKPRGLLLSSAVSPSKAVIDAGYDVPTLSEHFDWIAVMTYDFHGHWDKQTGHVAPLYYYPGDTYDYFNANFSLNYWIEQGADPRKIIMGMPLYGQSFSLADSNSNGMNQKSYGPGEAGEFTRAGGFLAFYEICERVKRQNWVVKRDTQGRIGPYAYNGNQWVSYDDISEIRRKSKLVKQLGLGGGMVWALDLDDFRNKCGCGRHPLLKTLNNELRGTFSDITLQNCT